MHRPLVVPIFRQSAIARFALGSNMTSGLHRPKDNGMALSVAAAVPNAGIISPYKADFPGVSPASLPAAPRWQGARPTDTSS